MGLIWKKLKDEYIIKNKVIFLEFLTTTEHNIKEIGVPKNAKCISQPPLHYREGTNIFAP
jgi:hypothetical protein